jgi:hypothetical protein
MWGYLSGRHKSRQGAGSPSRPTPGRGMALRRGVTRGSRTHPGLYSGTPLGFKTRDLPVFNPLWVTE